MEFKVDRIYMITGTDLGMLTVVETGKDIEEVIERCVTRGPLEKNPDGTFTYTPKDK
jgi:hypothetical protein